MKFAKLLLAVALLTGFVYGQQPVSVTQVAGNAVSTVATGVQKIGISDSGGNAFTSNSTTYTAKFGLDINELGTLGTAFTTPGFVDIKGADGNVFVRNATAANLKAAVNLFGNAGTIMDFAGQNATSPANALLTGGQFNTSPTTITDGHTSPLQLDSAGKLLVNAGAFGSTITLVPLATGGLGLGTTGQHLVAGASNNATSLKATAGQVYGVSVYNNAAYPVYLKFSNLGSAPTCGTTAVVYEVAVQAGTQREVHSEQGIAFGTGIAYCLVKGLADNDNTSVAAADATVDILFK